MKTPLYVPHADCVNVSAISARFSADRRHRYSLTIPFLGRETGVSLIVVGQNPSQADQCVADKTINYLEKFVFRNLPKYDQIIMLNLFTRMDKKKIEKDILDEYSNAHFESMITPNSDVLLVFGKLKNERAYTFRERAKDVRGVLSKNRLYKLAIGTEYAPHPGNPKITYSKLDIGIDEFKFC